jgi:hypothetical protein
MAVYGELDDTHRVEIFEGVVRDVFLPGLEGLGISTLSARAWLAQELDLLPQVGDSRPRQPGQE